MLSVIVLTKDNEDRIKTCLESVKWAQEIIVCDSGSKDQTLEIAKKYTSKIFTLNNQDFSATRNFGMEKASGDWVLYVDSDERVLEPLRVEIEKAVKENKYSAYAVSRKNIIFGTEVKYWPFFPDWVIRLLKRVDFETWVGKVHEYPKFKGKLGYAKNSFLHLTHRDIDQIVLKSLEWSKIDARLRLDDHPKMSALRFLRILFGELFYQGIWRRGFFNGTIGAMDAILQTFSLFVTYVRLWQLQQDKPVSEVYDDIDKKLVEDKFTYFK